jgi:hypothetical protein
MSAPKVYGSVIEEIKKAAVTNPWTEETVELLLSCTLNGGLQVIADAHNTARAKAFQMGVDSMRTGVAKGEGTEQQVSEQPQKWTPEYVQDMWSETFTTPVFFKKVSDRHNAAVAVAFERGASKLQFESEQEISAQQQNWTPEYVNELVMSVPLLERHKAVADAHNVAVAAERDWKQSAISVMPPLQEIGRELDLNLGESIHDKILPSIQKLKQQLATEREQKRELMDELHAANDRLAQAAESLRLNP